MPVPQVKEDGAPEFEWAAVVVPTAKHRAAAIRARKKESHANALAVLVTASGVAVLLLAVAILVLVVSQSEDTTKHPAKVRGNSLAIPPTATKSGRTAEPAMASQTVSRSGANAPPPLVDKLEKRNGPAQPTPDEVRALAQSLTNARAALSDYRFDRAKSELDKMQRLPMQPEHREKYRRLEVLAQHAEKFYVALSDAVRGLTVGTSIRLESGTELGVVSTAEDSLTVRVAGQNQTFRLSALPPALALAIADQFIEQKGEGALAFKAAYLLTHKNATDAKLGKAREWWKSAKTYGGQVANLDRVVDDQYDLEKDFGR